jgi:hypothetical protein
MKTMCERDPERWREPDPDDLDAREACHYCRRRRQCAAEAIKLDVVDGIWAGILMPPMPAGAHWRKALAIRDALVAELASIAAGSDSDGSDARMDGHTYSFNHVDQHGCSTVTVTVSGSHILAMTKNGCPVVLDSAEAKPLLKMWAKIACRI